MIETTVPPLPLLDELGKIEWRHGRRPGERWAARPLDIDMLLYGNDVVETAMLTLPHPRMSFRQFVLEPAAEIAPRMLHPIIGWPVERLLLHLNAASDQVALVSPSTDACHQLADVIQKQAGAIMAAAPTFATAEHHWPPLWTTWLSMHLPPKEPRAAFDASSSLPYAAAAFPKLTILLDASFAKPAEKLQWSTLVRQPGRGPTLRLQTADSAEIEMEALAAIAAVWPDLGP